MINVLTTVSNITHKNDWIVYTFNGILNTKNTANVINKFWTKVVIIAIEYVHLNLIKE